MRQAYGARNSERLVELKRAYDPTNFFRSNQNIEPQRPLGGHRPELWGPVFEPLRDDQELFRRVRVDEELGTIAWPKGADMDPDALHGNASRTPWLPPPSG